MEEEVKTGGAKLSFSSHYTISATGSQFTSPFFHPAPAGKQDALEIVEEAKTTTEDTTNTVNKAITQRGTIPS